MVRFPWNDDDMHIMLSQQIPFAKDRIRSKFDLNILFIDSVYGNLRPKTAQTLSL